MNHTRCLYLDNIRFIASFLVILGHSHPEYSSANEVYGLTQAGLWASLFGLMASPSSELFMTISGAILLPVKISGQEFFKKRFSKVLLPLCIWSLIYLSVGLGASNRTIIESLLTLPFTPVLDVFWFMYVICGLYLFAPIISKWLLCDNKSSIQYYLGIWCFISFLPLVNMLVPGFYNAQGSYYFSLNSFGGFMGYMILGAYLKRFQTSVTKQHFLYSIFLLILFSVCLFTAKAHFHVLPSGFIYDNLCFVSIVYVYTIFTIIQYLSTKCSIRIQGILTELAKHSFGIYLSHIFIIHFITQPLVSSLMLPPYLAIPIMAIVTYLCCYIIIKMITFLPKSKYMVGI